MTVYRDHGRKRGDSMDKLNSRVFYKMYLTNTVLMVVFVGILALISSHFSSKSVSYTHLDVYKRQVIAGLVQSAPGLDELAFFVKTL